MQVKATQFVCLEKAIILYKALLKELSFIHRSKEEQEKENSPTTHYLPQC